MTTIEIFGVGIAIIVALVLFLLVAKFFNLWLRARIANAPVSFTTLLAMWLRGVPNALIVDTRITAAKAGIPINTDQLEAHFLAGGEVTHVVLALIAADKAGIPLDYNRACAIDLACKGTGKPASIRRSSTARTRTWAVAAKSTPWRRMASPSVCVPASRCAQISTASSVVPRRRLSSHVSVRAS
jgi:uncharacterized protein YqfA (UPF0365 family)